MNGFSGENLRALTMQEKICLLLFFVVTAGVLYLVFAPFSKGPLSAIVDDDAETLQRLLEKGTSPNAIIHENRPTPRPMLHHAISRGSERCIDLLLDNGADLTSENWSGHTPLIELIVSNKLAPSSESRLLQRILPGSDLNRKSKSGETPLHFACTYSNVDVIEELIRWGASLTIHNNRGQTPLDVARERAISKQDEELLEMIERVENNRS